MVLVSFNPLTDRLIGEISTMLEGSPHRIVAVSSNAPSTPISLSLPEEDWSDCMETTSSECDKGLIGNNTISDNRGSHTSGQLRNMISPVLLKDHEIVFVNDALEHIYEGDLVICFVDSDSKESIMPVSFLSSSCISKGAFSLCMVIKRGTFRNIGALEDMNRMILDLGGHFHGVVCLSPTMYRERRYLELAHLIRHLGDLVFRSGIVNLDLADLLITSKGGTALIMTWGVAQPGGYKSRSSIRNALGNPLCDIDLSTVRKAMIHVISHKDLTLEDSLEATEFLRSRIKDNARLIWGVTLTEDNEEDMEILLVLATTPIELLLHWYGKNR
ncbi:MAG: hypothetical protein QCI82_06180 [Candidatus Thermoplasmatota archaeon]|nr:hypothetical protein [Candidatus Thermoplasmatota archaeon]